METQIIKIALADDHTLFRAALASVINKSGNFCVVIEANHGKDLIDKIVAGTVPDILLLDLNMPELDGYQTARWLQENYSAIHIIMLTMYDGEATMIRLLQAGVKGFFEKKYRL